MCLGIPGQLVELVAGNDQLARVEVSGVTRVVNVGLLEDEALGPGDWVLIHVGFAQHRSHDDPAHEERPEDRLGYPLGIDAGTDLHLGHMRFDQLDHRAAAMHVPSGGNERSYGGVGLCLSDQMRHRTSGGGGEQPDQIGNEGAEVLLQVARVHVASEVLGLSCDGFLNEFPLGAPVPINRRLPDAGVSCHRLDGEVAISLGGADGKGGVQDAAVRVDAAWPAPLAMYFGGDRLSRQIQRHHGQTSVSSRRCHWSGPPPSPHYAPIAPCFGLEADISERLERAKWPKKTFTVS